MKAGSWMDAGWLIVAPGDRGHKASWNRRHFPTHKKSVFSFLYKNPRADIGTGDWEPWVSAATFPISDGLVTA